jgi:hypothetical protein
MYGKLQACDHPELAPHFLCLHYGDVLKIHMRDHLIFFFKTCLSLDIIHQFILIATLKPTYG